MFKKLKAQYDAGYMTKETLRIYVKINKMKPGRGITEEEYEQITGEAFEETYQN